MKKFELNRILENDKLMLLLSFLIAVVLWVTVAVLSGSNTTQTIRNVPVDLAYNAAAYQSMGLDVVDGQEYTVDITVQGARSVVGNLTADDFVVYPQTSSVNQAGHYELPLVVSKVATLQEFEVVTASKTSVNVWFDQIVNKRFVVEIELLGLSVQDGYLLGQSYTTPGEVRISGPEQEVSQVARVVAQVQLKSDLTATIISSQSLMLIDQDGNALENTHITIDSPQVEVTIPVMKKAELPIKLQFTNVPAGFDPSTLTYSLSAQSIQLAGAANILETMDGVEIGPIDLQKFTLGAQYNFEIALPTGFTNLSNISQITVEFDEEGYTQRTLSVGDIRLIGVPAGAEVTLQTTRLGAVKLIGLEAQLTALTGANLYAEVDCSGLVITRGQQTVAAKVIVTGNSGVFATGTYTVVVNVAPEG